MRGDRTERVMEERDEREKTSPREEGKDEVDWKEGAVTVLLLTRRQEKFRAPLK